MNTTFDPAKDALNVAKHGVSLVAPMDGRLWVVVFTDRPEGRHIISLRKANLREYHRYEQAP